jgi:hypothetical protein
VLPHLFSYFYAEAETNAETPETNMKTDTFGNKYGTNTVRMQTKSRRLSELRDHLNHAEKLKKVNKIKKLLP